MVLIYFAQAVDPRYNPITCPPDRVVYFLLLRDIERICGYFARYGVKADAHELAAEMWASHVGAVL